LTAGETIGETCLKHIVTNAGDATVFNCPGGAKWQYKPFGSNATYKLGNGDAPIYNTHFRDSYVVQKTSQNGINLQINSTRREDAGTFTCVVIYDIETEGYTTSAELVILGKHYILSLNQNLKNKFAPRIQGANLQCRKHTQLQIKEKFGHYNGPRNL